MKRTGIIVGFLLLASLLTAVGCSYQQDFVKGEAIQSRARWTAVLPLANLTSADRQQSGSHCLILTETGNRSLLLLVNIKNPLQTGETQDVHNCRSR